jgi:hypothetical protein
VPYREMLCLSDDFDCESTLFLTVLSMKQYMYIEVKPHMFGDL